MDEKPGIVKFTPHSTSRSAMLIAVAVTVGVQVALCAVLVAIHLQDMWFPSVQGGEVEMTFVSPSEEVSTGDGRSSAYICCSGCSSFHSQPCSGDCVR